MYQSQLSCFKNTWNIGLLFETAEVAATVKLSKLPINRGANIIHIISWSLKTFLSSQTLQDLSFTLRMSLSRPTNTGYQTSNTTA